MSVNCENKVSVLNESRASTEVPSSFLNHGAEIDPFPVTTAAEEREREKEREGERKREGGRDVSLVGRWKRRRRMQI